MDSRSKSVIADELGLVSLEVSWPQVPTSATPAIVRRSFTGHVAWQRLDLDGSVGWADRDDARTLGAGCDRCPAYAAPRE